MRFGLDIDNRKLFNELSATNNLSFSYPYYKDI